MTETMTQSTWLDDALHLRTREEDLYLVICHQAKIAKNAGILPYSVRMNRFTLDMLGKYLRRVKTDTGGFWVMDTPSGILRVEVVKHFPDERIDVTIVPRMGTSYAQIYERNEDERS